MQAVHMKKKVLNEIMVALLAAAGLLHGATHTFEPGDSIATSEAVMRDLTIRHGDSSAHGGSGIMAANNTLCVYCGSKNFGAGCPHSPDKKHRHLPDGLHCIWCGSTNYGKGCPHAPDRIHVRG